MSHDTPANGHAAPPRPPFWCQLTSEILSNWQPWLPDNVDYWRFADPHPLKRRFETAVQQALASLGFFKRPWSSQDAIQRLMSAGSFDHAMDLMADDASRELLVKLMAFRILGSRHYSLPLNNSSFWQLRATVSDYVKRKAVVNDVPHLGALDEFDFQGVRLIAHSLMLLNTYLLQQYRCQRADIGVRPGDTVIDGGACWGDTSLYFARQAKRVFAYECVPFNTSLFQRNMELNPGLARKITLIPKALWDASGQTLTFRVDGSASRADSSATELSVKTQTIDDLVQEQNLDRVDFIKMDIEGAETSALLGAEQTLRHFRPRLAICVYHSERDFVRIPEWLASLDVGYRLYLDHFTIYGEESILFAEGPSAAV